MQGIPGGPYTRIPFFFKTERREYMEKYAYTICRILIPVSLFLLAWIAKLKFKIKIKDSVINRQCMDIHDLFRDRKDLVLQRMEKDAGKNE